jgi:hypothetical protein
MAVRHQGGPLHGGGGDEEDLAWVIASNAAVLPQTPPK